MNVKYLVYLLTDHSMELFQSSDLNPSLKTLSPPPQLEGGALGSWRGRPELWEAVLCQAPGAAGGRHKHSQAWGRGEDGAGAGHAGGPAEAPAPGPAFRSPSSHQVPVSQARPGFVALPPSSTPWPLPGPCLAASPIQPSGAGRLGGLQGRLSAT